MLTLFSLNLQQNRFHHHALGSDTGRVPNSVNLIHTLQGLRGWLVEGLTVAEVGCWPDT